LESDGADDDNTNATIYVASTNQWALEALYKWWRWYDGGNATVQGFAPLRDLFERIEFIRYWNADDRIRQTAIIPYLEEEIALGETIVDLEIELWFRSSATKRRLIEEHWDRLINAASGQIVTRSCVPEIRYHGLLVRVPTSLATEIVRDPHGSFVSSDCTVQCLQDVGQGIDRVVDETSDLAAMPLEPVLPGTLKPPVAAILDTLPVANHPALAGFIRLQDPDDWSPDVPVHAREHGTAMASLIVHGDLKAASAMIDRAVIALPILKPAGRSREAFPKDRLMVDLLQQRINQLMDTAEGRQVRVVNLSIGDSRTRLDRTVSKLGRIIDHLAWRHKLLFVVSAGNAPCQFLIGDAGSFMSISNEALGAASVNAIGRARPERRIISPADSINALTVGSVYADGDAEPMPPNIRVIETGRCFPAPYSREGRGFRRAVKPDLAAEGGRIGFREAVPSTSIRAVESGRPGQRVAHPDGGYANSRGTSNAAAIVTRYTHFGASIIEELRESNGYSIPPSAEAVLLKAMIAHAAQFDPVVTAIAELGAPEEVALQLAELTTGYGAFDADRFGACSAKRAILFGIGELEADRAHEYTVPIPSILVGTSSPRRLTITLAYLSPINPSNQLYRAAKLQVTVGAQELKTTVGVGPSMFERNRAARGTLQQLVFHGTSPVASSSERLLLNISCRSEATVELPSAVPYAIIVTLETSADVDIAVYEAVAAALVQLRQEVVVPVTAP